MKVKQMCSYPWDMVPKRAKPTINKTNITAKKLKDLGFVKLYSAFNRCYPILYAHDYLPVGCYIGQNKNHEWSFYKKSNGIAYYEEDRWLPSMTFIIPYLSEKLIERGKEIKAAEIRNMLKEEACAQ